MRDRWITLGWALGCVAKGAIVSFLLFVVADASFSHALIVASVSATITGMFLIASTRLTRRTDEKIDSMKLVMEAQAAQAEHDRKIIHAEEEAERAEEHDLADQVREELAEAHAPPAHPPAKRRRRKR